MVKRYVYTSNTSSSRKHSQIWQSLDGIDRDSAFHHAPNVMRTIYLRHELFIVQDTGTNPAVVWCGSCLCQEAKQPTRVALACSLPKKRTDSTCIPPLRIDLSHFIDALSQPEQPRSRRPDPPTWNPSYLLGGLSLSYMLHPTHAAVVAVCVQRFWCRRSQRDSR